MRYGTPPVFSGRYRIEQATMASPSGFGLTAPVRQLTRMPHFFAALFATPAIRAAESGAG
jgi:hypothetical protein